jgi:hypothetical protein
MKKLIPTLSEAKSAGSTLGLGILGFVGANQVNKILNEKVTKGKTPIKGAMAITAALGSVKVTNVHLKALLMSVALFFGVSTLNDLSQVTALQGDGEGGIKQKLADIIQKYVPSLGDPNGEQWLQQSEYQFLNSSMGNTADLLGLGNPVMDYAPEPYMISSQAGVGNTDLF